MPIRAEHPIQEPVRFSGLRGAEVQLLLLLQPHPSALQAELAGGQRMTRLR